MLPRVKLYFAGALSLFVITLCLLTNAEVPAQSPSPKPISASPLIAFRPFTKKAVATNWFGASAAEAAVLAVVDVYESGTKRYVVTGKVLKGRSGAGGDGEKIVFDRAVTIVQGTPPPSAPSFPLYLELASNKRPCWHLNDSSLSSNADSSIKHKRLGRLIDSTNLPVCKP